MAFIKKDWKCGDTITADDLNRLENGVEEALDGGSVDCGYSCTEEWITLTDESVTTEVPTGVVNPVPVASLLYSGQIEADTIRVTFNDTVYECKRKTDGIVPYYGASLPGSASDWSQYPFAIVSSQGSNTLYTETAGTYQVKIEAFEDIIETSECFEKARGYSCSESVTTYVNETVVFA